MGVNVVAHRQTLGNQRAQVGGIHWVPPLGTHRTSIREGGEIVGARGSKENSPQNQLIRAHGPLRRLNKPSMWALGSLADVMIVGLVFGGSPRSGNAGIIDSFSCSWELFPTNQLPYPALI